MIGKKPKKNVRETAVDLLARRDHSVAEIRRKLRDKGFATDEVAECVEVLVEKGFLDDRKYAAGRARYRAVVSKWGWIRISLELKMNGVNDEAVEGAKTALEEEGVNFEEQATLLVERMQGKPVDQQRALLGRKGYTSAQIRHSLSTVNDSLGQLGGLTEDEEA